MVGVGNEYETFSENFKYAAEKTHNVEQGYNNNPDDLGGETKYGITKREFPNEDIKNLTKERALYLLKTRYWDVMLLDLVKSKLVAAEIYDTGVNCGPGTAVRISQRAANALNQSNVAVDGAMGEITAAALNVASKRSEKALLLTLNGLQCARYVELTEKRELNKKFFKGWILKRVTLS